LRGVCMLFLLGIPYYLAVASSSGGNPSVAF
jgi:hypothetical protein